MINYTELDVWKHCRSLCNEIYTLAKSFPTEELFGLTNQIRRAAVSMPSNIAEGIGRNTKKEISHFLYISRGSLFELETQLFLSYDQNYISSESLNKALENIVACKKLLNGFINYYKE